MIDTEGLQGEWITSVGIDLGTSTTKMIVSQLLVSRVSGLSSLPVYHITERRLLYSSDIYTTPLLGEEELDYDAVTHILEREYAKAGITLDQIQSGAIIITGETANKRNAKRVLHELADRAGDFVVATAGAVLEAILAGKGSGAAARSLETGELIVNIDIGGGTANAVFFRAGNCVATATLRIGGRLIRFNQEGMILEIAHSFCPWLEANGWKWSVGISVDLHDLREVTYRMAETLLDYMLGTGDKVEDQSQRDMINNDLANIRLLAVGELPESLPKADVLMLSGGVAELLDSAEPLTLCEAAVHEDIGPLLAHAIDRVARSRNITRIQPDQTVRATVIGAGMQSTEIAGATVHIDPGLLPVRNVPVVTISISPGMIDRSGEIDKVINETIKLACIQLGNEGSPPFALYLDGNEYYSYRHLQMIAQSLCDSFADHCPNADAVVIICSSDMGKALGQAISRRVRDNIRVVCIDGVKVEHGDFIDIGEPVTGSLVPVIVKTLVFSSSRG